MSNYNKIIPTLSGNNLLVESIKSKKPLIFTKIALGDGTLRENESIESLTALKRQMCENTIQDVKNKGNGELDITATISNASVTSGFYARELGVFAKVGDTGQERLFGYTNAGAQASYTPAGTSLDEKLITVTFYVGNDINVKISLNSQLYITQGALDKHNSAMDAHAELLKLFLRLTGGTLTGDLGLIRSNINFKNNINDFGCKIRIAENGNFDIGVTEDGSNKNATLQMMLHSQNKPKWYNSSLGGKELATVEELSPIKTLLGQGGIVASKLDGQNGFVKFANDFTIQFGRANITANTSQVNIVLPIRCNTIFACSANDVGTGAFPLGIDGNQTQITVRKQLKEENTQAFIGFSWIVLSK